MPPVIIFIFGLFLQNISIHFNKLWLVWNGKNKFERVQPKKRKPSWAKKCLSLDWPRVILATGGPKVFLVIG